MFFWLHMPFAYERKCDIYKLWKCDIYKLWKCDIDKLWKCDIYKLWKCDIDKLWKLQENRIILHFKALIITFNLV